MKITRFKDYNGNTIIVDPHKHSVTDTVNAQGTTAFATQSTDGFMSKTDKTNLDNLNAKVANAKIKIKDIVYLYPSITLLDGPSFNTTLTKVGPNATSIVFNKTAIPAAKKASATVVSSTDSEAKAYMYLDGTTVYVCPENADYTVYMNKNSSNMFLNCTNLTSINLAGVTTNKLINTIAMFKNCTKVTCTLIIHNDFITNYSEMFKGAATASTAKITVNYKSDGKASATRIVTTKDSTSNVVLGTAVV